MDKFADRYELVQCIGRGGFGSVWLANDAALGREVAIKRLNISDAGDPDSSSARRLEREAIATARLDHPNVVRVYDAGMLAQTEEIYLVMERLSGRTLLEELAEIGPIEAERARALMAGALRGLQEAHREGIVHKDLKPANLFIVNPGRPNEMMKVIDFGIARMNSLDKLTRTGRMAGSPRYLAPEYILESDVTPRVDIYQMGLILAEMVSGRPCVPRGLQFVTACQHHVKGKLEFDPDFIATPMGRVAARATARDPDERFRSAAEFATALEEAPLPAQRFTLPPEKITAQWSSVSDRPLEEPSPLASPHSSDEDAFQISSEALWIIIAAAAGLTVVAFIAVAALLYARHAAEADVERAEPTSAVAAANQEPSGGESVSVSEVIGMASYDLETAVMLSQLQASDSGSALVEKRAKQKQAEERRRRTSSGL